MNLVTEVSNNRAELLAVYNKEVEVLQELEKAITNRANKVNNGDKARITARLMAVTKALTEVVSVEAGKALLAEQKELKEELTLTERIEQNMKDGVKAELEALAIPFYQQEPRAFQALQNLYTEIYRTTTPDTVAQDLKATQELVRKKVGLGNIVKHTLKEHGVFNRTGSDKVVKTAKGTVILGHNSSVNIRALEGLKETVERGGR